MGYNIVTRSGSLSEEGVLCLRSPTNDMRILVCNERFLFRFGADRVMMIIAKGLHELGHSITMMANRFDRPILEPFASRIIEAPVEGSEYINLNEFTAAWLRRNWDELFDSENMPDAVLIGGWPFLSAIPVFRERGVRVIFLDCGVVPLDKYSEGMRVNLEKLKSLRRKYLRQCSLITGISDFIVRTQSILDAEGLAPVRTIHCGADHMQLAMWPAGELDDALPGGKAIGLVTSLQRQKRPVILCLGRWEPNCYKNSDSAYPLMRTLQSEMPGCALLVLEDPAKAGIPEEFKNTIIPIGFPDDAELSQLMETVDLGVSLSLWEGFNLPLAEMQWLNRQALVLDVGAHPEVVMHPWYLCRDIHEMARKACAIVGGRGLDVAAREQAAARFHEYFTWKRVIGDYQNLMAELIAEPAPISPLYRKSSHKSNGLTMVIDVSDSARDPANSGVVRVTRRLGRTLQSQIDPLFVVWDAENYRYVLPTKEECAQLGQFNGPVVDNPGRISPGYDQRVDLDDVLPDMQSGNCWLLIAETIQETRFRHIRPYARFRNMRLAAIFYDAIAVLRPDLCSPQVTMNHGGYMKGLAECDMIFPISQFSADCLVEFWRERRISPAPVETNLLCGEFGGSERNRSLDKYAGRTAGRQVNILCVSTLEPRKNHHTLIAAFLQLQEQYPELQCKLTLVGNKYAGAFDIADYVAAVCKRNPNIQWLGIVDDDTLHRLYREAAFTVYPSEIEGFGMPIIESLWHGRPCLCRNEGVMAELARDGGCLTVDTSSSEALAAAMRRMAGDSKLLRDLAVEATARNLKTWRDYARKTVETLVLQRENDQKEPLMFDWQERLYPDCLLDRWQMNESEKIALTGLLARHKPACSIEIGTYHGGSLSLISQFSGAVFSIDIDPEIPQRMGGRFPNVTFLTGDSSEVLPLLFEQLDKLDLPVEFILVDGDHSAHGVTRDLNLVLQYIPKKPMFVMAHDCFNPACRSGMLEAEWSSSPYCHWVDLDFVPGRVVEHGGGGDGEMWGGLAIAYFLPEPRTGPLVIRRTADKMFHLLQQAAYTASC